MSLYVGIDPGASGGIAAVSELGDPIFVTAMPATPRDLFDTLSTLRANERDMRAVLEFVRSSPQMGVKSAFTFGQSYGAIRMALTAAGIPFDDVTPPKWQAVMQCLTKGDKGITKARAQQLFPTVRVTHATADALLLAEFCRRQERGGHADPA